MSNPLDPISEIKIFVGGLPLHITTDDLKDYFHQFGDIIDCVVMTESMTKKSRGFGFVEFSSPESVKQVLDHLPHLIGGKEVDVKRAVKKDPTDPRSSKSQIRTKKIFVGGIDPAVDEDVLRQEFNDFGNIEEVMVMREKEGRPRGFGFVVFDLEDTVDRIMATGTPKGDSPGVMINIQGKPCEVKRAIPQSAIPPRLERDGPRGGGGRDRYGPPQSFRGGDRYGPPPPYQRSPYDYPEDRRAGGGPMRGGPGYYNRPPPMQSQAPRPYYPPQPSMPQRAEYDRAGYPGYPAQPVASPYEQPRYQQPPHVPSSHAPAPYRGDSSGYGYPQQQQASQYQHPTSAYGASGYPQGNAYSQPPPTASYPDWTPPPTATLSTSRGPSSYYGTPDPYAGQQQQQRGGYESYAGQQQPPSSGYDESAYRVGYAAQSAPRAQPPTSYPSAPAPASATTTGRYAPY